MKHPTRTGIGLIALAIFLIVAAALVGECSVVNGNTREGDAIEQARLTYWAVIQALAAMAMCVMAFVAGCAAVEILGNRAGGGA